MPRTHAQVKADPPETDIVSDEPELTEAAKILERSADVLRHEAGNAPTLSRARLAEITTLDEAMAALGGDILDVEDVDDGDGYEFIPDKTELIGKPLFLVQWQFVDAAKSPLGLNGVVVWALTTGERKVRFYDSGAGIYQQLYRITEAHHRWGGLRLPNGLRVSRYPHEMPNGQTVMASTFYLDTSR